MKNATFVITVLVLPLLVLGCAEFDFQVAQEADTIGAYQQFIKSYPDNRLAERAKRRIAELIRIKAKFSEILSEARTVRFTISMDKPALIPSSENRRLRSKLREIACWTLTSAGYRVVEQGSVQCDLSLTLSNIRISEFYEGSRFLGYERHWQLSGRLRARRPGDSEVAVPLVGGAPVFVRMFRDPVSQLLDNFGYVAVASEIVSLLTEERLLRLASKEGVLARGWQGAVQRCAIKRLKSLGIGSSRKYPAGDYFASAAEWNVVINKWRKRYENDRCVYVPRRPTVDQFISQGLFRKAPLRVAVLGVVNTPVRIQDSVTNYQGSGFWEIKTRKALQVGSPPPRPAGENVDFTRDVAAAIQRSLGNSPRFVVVDSNSLNAVFRQRALRSVFSNPADIGNLTHIEGADCLIVAKVSGLRYLVCCGAVCEPTVGFTSFVIQDYAYSVDIDVRMFDASSGRLLWSAACQYGPRHLIRFPVVFHPWAREELPQALVVGFDTPWIADAATEFLVNSLLWRLSGRQGGVPDSLRTVIAQKRDLW